MGRLDFRAGVLGAYGASGLETEELLVYNENVFDRHCLTLPLKLPLESELHVSAWRQYATAAREVGVFAALRQRLVQLQFPVQEGISQTEAYQSATRRGVSVNGIPATGLVLRQPELLQLIMHESLAGAIPVLIAGNREDFVALVRALTKRNEPKPIPDSMGACIVAGFNNWDRVRQYRQEWKAAHPGHCSDADWAAEFRQFILRRELYQDKFIILSSGSYSDVPACDVGLSEPEWQRLSLKIRMEHECTHYFTRRLFASMRNNLLDEAIADYRGIVAAAGHYRADWFLRFLGLESFPVVRERGRLQNYRGQPPLSDGAFKVLGALVTAGAKNLERFDTEHADELRTPDEQAVMLMALADLTLEELASEEAVFFIQSAIDNARSNFLPCQN